MQEKVSRSKLLSLRASPVDDLITNSRPEDERPNAGDLVAQGVLSNLKDLSEPRP